MKSTARIGQTFEFEIEVTHEMRARFEAVTVHDLYSTASMLTHMEWAARQHLLPALEPGEEGVGYHMNIDHLAPVPIGETVRIRAIVTGILPKRLICHCEAYHQHRKIGKATVVQAVLPLSNLHARIPTTSADTK